MPTSRDQGLHLNNEGPLDSLYGEYDDTSDGLRPFESDVSNASTHSIASLAPEIHESGSSFVSEDLLAWNLPSGALPVTSCYQSGNLGQVSQVFNPLGSLGAEFINAISATQQPWHTQYSDMMASSCSYGYSDTMIQSEMSLDSGGGLMDESGLNGPSNGWSYSDLLPEQWSGVHTALSIPLQAIEPCNRRMHSLSQWSWAALQSSLNSNLAIPMHALQPNTPLNTDAPRTGKQKRSSNATESHGGTTTSVKRFRSRGVPDDMCFGFTLDSPVSKVRRERQEEINFMRKTGACVRCKLLKLRVSTKVPFWPLFRLTELVLG